MSRASDPIRVAVVGFGTAGRYFHAPFIASNPSLALDTIVTASPVRAAQAKAEYPDVRILPTVDDLWERAPSIEVVVVASPSGTHAEIAGAALQAGCHVVVDKPMAATAEQGERLRSAAQERGLLLTVYQNRRWDGDFLTLQDLVAEGRLGQVYRFESRFEWWQPTAAGWKWATPAAEAGGILFDLGPHLIDQAVLLFGPASIASAEVDTRRAGVVADDDAFVALEHECGVRSHLWMSAVAASPGPRFRVIGSEATYTSWGLDGQELALISGVRPHDEGFGETPADRWGELAGSGQPRPVPTRRGDYGRFYSLLADALNLDAAPPVDPHDAIACLRLLADARAASARHA